MHAVIHPLVAPARTIVLALLVAAAGAPGGAAETPPPGGWFEELTQGAPSFGHAAGNEGRFLLPEITCGAGGVLDYDGDGDLDLFLAQGGSLDPGADPAARPPDALYRNDLVASPSGTLSARFVDVTAAAAIPDGGYGCGVAAGDVDGDGAVDLYVSNVGPNRLLRNRGDGTFEDVTAAAGAGDDRWSVGAVLSDLDRDGALDLFVANYADPRLAEEKPCRTATGARDYCNPAAYEPLPNRLWRGRGDGTFEDVSAKSGIDRLAARSLGVVAADLDGDERPDLYVANDGEPNHLWLQQADGRFREEALLAGCAVNGRGQAEASMGVDAEDVDGDGDRDLFMTHLTGETNTLFRNEGGGVFSDASAATGLGPPSWPGTAWGIAWVDLEGDGWRDVAIANGAVRAVEALLGQGDPYPFDQPNLLLRNQGGGVFVDATAEGGPPFGRSEVSRALVAADLDEDGDADLLLVNNNGPARVLVHRGSPGRWLGVQLVSRAGADASSGSVSVRPEGGRARVHFPRTDGSYASAGDPRALTGLGDTTGPVSAEIGWPDGRRSRHLDLAPGTYYVAVASPEAGPRPATGDAP